MLLYEVFTGEFQQIENWYGYTSIFTWNMSVLLFAFVCGIDAGHMRKIVTGPIRLISKHSLGIYILHVMILQMLRKLLGFEAKIMNPWLYPFVSVAVVITICSVLTVVLKKIKWIRNLV